MNISIQSIHFDADRKLQNFIKEKVEKLTHFSQDIIEAEVYLRLEKNDHTENKLAEIKLIIPGNDLFAKKQCKTFEEAIDLTVEALRRQLKKRKDKIRSANGASPLKTIL